MQIGRSLTSITALATLLMAAAPMAAAQTGRPWVDPPAETGTAPAQAPKPLNEAPASPPPQATTPAPASATPPTQSAQPQAPAVPQPAPTVAQPLKDRDADKRSARASVAKDFAIDYLESWSASNDVALEATAAFYAPRILFHGREVSMQRLFNEKRRFVRRWPERDYRPRQDAIGSTCNPPGEICTVHAVFDFTASHPKRRRVSQGTGALQLIVHFIGDKPVIVAEHSTLLGQERKGNLALEGASHD
ncbi:hypothetical protein [Microvirga sp. VF16]|uniref:hypothetical protein n=1 Tax=Microvirga sp. VF16 TaxID=2807101 RepID=UPI00193D5FD4|nr:hypothetical protein [Microvirga sp. VF16]QRM29359.1 hypothetical protein JO965_24880 [Microvirga sp. VF16]